MEVADLALLPGAQWTGVLSTVALAMLRSGMVDAVACVGAAPDNALKPRPFLALTEARAARDTPLAALR